MGRRCRDGIIADDEVRFDGEGTAMPSVALAPKTLREGCESRGWSHVWETVLDRSSFLPVASLLNGQTVDNDLPTDMRG